MADAKKQLDLVLNVVPNAQSAASGLASLDARLAGLQATIDKLGSAVDKAGSKTEEAVNKASGGLSLSGAVGTVADAAGGLAKIGLKGMALAGAGLTAFVQFEDAFQRLGYEFLTGREKLLGFTSAIPLVGDAISGFLTQVMDAADRLSAPGAAKQLARDALTMGADLKRQETRWGYERQVYGLRQQDLTAGYSAQALAELPTLASERARFAGNSAGVMANRYGAPYAAGAATGPLGAALFGAAAVGGAGAMGSKFGEKGIDDRLTEANEALRAAQRAERAAQLAAEASEADVTGAREVRDRAMAALRPAQAAADRERNALLRSPDAPGRNDYSRIRAQGGSRGAAALGFLVGGLYDIGATVFGAFGGENELDPTRQSIDRGFRGGGTGNKIEALAAMNNETRALALAQQSLADLEAKTTLNNERQLDLLKQRNEVEKTRTKIMRANLSILDDELAKTKTGARQFGQYDDATKTGIVDALERFRAGGRENVAAGELALLQGNALTAEEVGKRLEKDASKDPEFQRLLKLVGGRDVETLQLERDRKKAEIDLKVQADEVQFARLMEASLKKLNLKDLLGELIRQQFELKMRGISTEADLARIQRS